MEGRLASEDPGRGRTVRVSRAALAAAALLVPFVALAGRDLWTAVGLRSVGNVLLLAGAPTVPATIYAATATVLFRSSDRGSTWAALPIPPTVTALVADPHLPTTIYAGTSFSGGLFDPEAGAIYRSVDGGGHWIPATSGIQAAVLSLAADPASSAVYCGTTRGAFRSSDAGSNWMPVGSTLGIERVQALASDPGRSPTRLYAAGDGGVYASADGGVSWTFAASGLGSLAVTTLACDPRPAGILYAGTNGAGVFRSDDGGASWTRASQGLSNLQVFALALDPSRPSMLYVGTNGGVFRSEDGASTWIVANEGLPSIFVAALAVDPSTPGLVYASVLGPGLFQRSFAARAPRTVPFR